MLDIIIDRTIHGAHVIKCDGVKCIYYGVTLREALRRYRAENGLRYRHFNIINISEV